MLKKVWTRKKLQQAFSKKSQQMKKHFILRKWHAETENLTQKRNEINKIEQKKLTKFKFEIYNVIFNFFQILTFSNFLNFSKFFNFFKFF